MDTDKHGSESPESADGHATEQPVEGVLLQVETVCRAALLVSVKDARRLASQRIREDSIGTIFAMAENFRRAAEAFLAFRREIEAVHLAECERVANGGD